MKRFGCFLLTSLFLSAQVTGGFEFEVPDVRKMTSADMHSTGLDKLTQRQQNALNDWVVKQTLAMINRSMSETAKNPSDAYLLYYACGKAKGQYDVYVAYGRAEAAKQVGAIIEDTCANVVDASEQSLRRHKGDQQ